MINLTLIDPNPIRRQQLLELLQAKPTDYQLTEHTEQADIVLIDLKTALLSLLPQPHSNKPHTLLLVDDAEQEEEEILTLLAHGCRGCINLKSEASLLTKAIQTVASGDAWISRRILGQMMERKLRWQHQQDNPESHS